MKEYRFKILRDNEDLYSFSDAEMIIKNADGKYKIYKIQGFNEEKPMFLRDFKIVSIFKESVFNDKVVIVKKKGLFAVYKIDKFEDRMPILNRNFVVIISQGAGKIEVFDSETRISLEIPAKGN